MTIFKKILDGELPCDSVYEDELCLAFRDINPIAPCHVLIIPKKVLSRLSDAKSEDTALLGHLMQVANKVASLEGYEDFQVLINNGAAAGQTVFHLHLHVIAGNPLRLTH